MLTFQGGNRPELRLRAASPAVLLAAAMLVVIALEALGPTTLRDDLILVLGFSSARPFPGLITQWMVHSASLMAVTNALYALAAGMKLQADLGAPITWGLFLAGGMIGVAIHAVLGIDATVVGASGAVALWMGAAAAPYSMGPPEIAWGTLGVRAVGVRAPFIAVAVLWFLHHGLGIVLADPSGPGSRLYAGWLAVFGIGVGAGWGLRAVRKAFRGHADTAVADPVQEDTDAEDGDDLPMEQVQELMQRRPRQAARALQDYLETNPTHVGASVALIDALALIGEKSGIVEEGLARIRLLLRQENGAGAAQIFEQVMKTGADAALAKRLSSAQASTVMLALSERKLLKAARTLGERWLAAHPQDSLAWRVKQALRELGTGD